MDIQEARRRDRVLRDYFEGRDWDEGIEPKLVREVVLGSFELLPEHRYLVGYEWEPAPGHSSGGRGDLLFTDGFGRYAVVEVKSIHGSGSNTSRRNKVEGQALEYRAAVFARFDDVVAVEAHVYSDDDRYPGLRSPETRQPGRLPTETLIRSTVTRLAEPGCGTFGVETRT